MKKQLKNITLFGADYKIDRLLKAFEVCENYFDFDEKIIITHTKENFTTKSGIKVYNGELNSIEDYSEFMIKKLNNYIKTDYVLVVQYDGFILNSKAWDDNFLNYDYIGAPWWYNDNNVGNGGFSLRSKKLLEILANDKSIIQTHPEDHHICRTYGEYLKSLGIKFAPENIAKKFSIEGDLYEPVGAKYGSIWNGEFGFHSLKETDISNWKDFKRFFG